MLEFESTENFRLSKGFESYHFVGHIRLRGVLMLKWISKILVVEMIKTRGQDGNLFDRENKFELNRRSHRLMHIHDSVSASNHPVTMIWNWNKRCPCSG
jgi:hypothetical protein